MTKRKIVLTQKKERILTVILVILLFALSFTGGYLVRRLSESKKLRSLSWLIEVIDSNYCYYDEQTGEYKTFTTEDYAKAITDGLLDKYSTFYTSEEYKDEVSTRQGKRYGIGLGFLKTEEKPKIYSVTFNSPAEKVGLTPGELLVACGLAGNRTEISSYQDFDAFIKNVDEGVDFTLYTMKDGETEESSYTIKKEVYVSSFVKYSDSVLGYSFSFDKSGAVLKTEISSFISGLSQDTAYITLRSFSGNAGKELKTALDIMKERGKTKLILDIRDNGGGLLNVLSEICSYLVDSGSSGPLAIAYSQDKRGNYTTYYSKNREFYNNLNKICVLANGNTASASECLIGAMLYYGAGFSQDNLIIEKTGNKTTTYGKGIAQTTYLNYKTGEAVSLTTEYMFLPDKTTCIHGVGFKPNENNLTESQTTIPRAIEILAN